MPILIRGGTIVTADAERVADIFAEQETITRIESSIDPRSVPAKTEIIDATGHLVFPGFIDPHVHIHLPFMGTNAADNHDTATRAALAGGTTTIIEMICPGPSDEPRDSFKTWYDLAAASAHCDFTFHQSVVRFDALAREQLRELVQSRGVASFKVFLAYKGALDLSDHDLLGLMEMAKELGVIVTAHCENADAVAFMQAKLIAAGCTSTHFHEPSRPVAVEADGVHHLCTFASLTGAHVYIVHTSCHEALTQAQEARDRGVRVWIEAVVPHLIFDKTAAERPDFEGAKYIMSPPLRDASNIDCLWNAIARRDVSTIGTDHAPFHFHTQKVLGKSAFTAIPNGIGSIQERVDLLFTFGVCAGRIDRRTLVDAASTQPAKIFGLFPKKGTIAVGSDADLVVYDPNHRGQFSRNTSLSALDYNAYEGMECRGRSHIVTLRGRVVARDGQYIGGDGGGQYLPRTPTHF
ncbi:MAG: dihydropyrimidinase [Planctomycetota bacterium]|nr:dihydropyrimidinase [Planctomycetota bacterium]